MQKSDSSNGDINGYTVYYTIDLSTDDGDFKTVVDGALTGKTSSRYQRAHRIDLPDATEHWVVRVTRTTSDSTSALIADRTDIDSITEIIDAKMRYPNSAYVGITIDASQFQSIPTRAFHLKGRIIRVPSNYDPVARTYSGTWDGTFKPAYSNNPAWVYYDIATNARYGLGKHLTEA